MTKIFEKVNPKILFFSSILCLPPIFFQENLVYLWIIAFLFVILLKVKRGKLRLLPSLFIFISIVFFSLLTPSGKIYFSIGTLRITEGALFIGLEKAGILLSMVYISQYAISKNLKVGGRIGLFLNAMFYYFDKLTEHKTVFNVKNPIISIDSILLEVYDNTTLKNIEEQPNEYKHDFFSWTVCLFPLLLSYTFLILSII